MPCIFGTLADKGRKAVHGGHCKLDWQESKRKRERGAGRKGPCCCCSTTHAQRLLSLRRICLHLKRWFFRSAGGTLESDHARSIISNQARLYVSTRTGPFSFLQVYLSCTFELFFLPEKARFRDRPADC